MNEGIKPIEPSPAETGAIAHSLIEDFKQGLFKYESFRNKATDIALGGSHPAEIIVFSDGAKADTLYELRIVNQSKVQFFRITKEVKGNITIVSLLSQRDRNSNFRYGEVTLANSSGTISGKAAMEEVKKEFPEFLDQK